jgi:phage gp46-like protein
MSILRQGDIYIYLTEDGAEISVINGEPVMDGGFESAVLISLFANENKDHWMNEYMSEDEKMKGNFYSFIKNTAKTLTTMRKAEELAKLDLQWFIDIKAADDIQVTINSESPIRINMEINILADGNTIFNRTYGVNWIYMMTDPASGRI